MSLLRRRGILKISSGGGGLPSEYQQVEYIGISANGPYLATNYTPIQGDEIECAFELNGTALATLFSAGTGTYQTIFSPEGGRNCCYIKAFQTGKASVASKWNTNRMTLLLKNPTSILSTTSGDVSVSTPFQGELDGDQTTLWLFRRRNGGDGVASIIYSFLIVNSGVTKLNLIPCYRKSDGVIGMYDMVSQTFYTNVGTGTFTKGADVN